jgi:ElaB/YqjD/DUF883 family membrane-anchored ribosome-binding protein
MANNLEDEVRYLHKKLDQLMQGLEKQVHNRSEDIYGLQDKANKLGKKFRSCCDEWTSKSSDNFDKIKSSAQDGAKKIKDTAENNVLISLGVSALVGWLIAKLFSSRRD